MIIKEIIDIMQSYAHTSLALSFDNVGLIVGDSNVEITGITIAVDVTSSCIEQCIRDNTNLLIVHHPIIFSPIKSISSDSYVGKLLLQLIRNKINVYVSHTNMDNSEIGINHTLARLLGCERSTSLMCDGTGAVGKIEDINFSDLSNRLRTVTGDDNIRCYGDKNKTVRNIAIISGAGGRDSDVVDVIKVRDIDAFVSGEFKYSIILELLSMGVNVIDVSHYECEKIFIDIVYDILNKVQLSGIDIVKYYLFP